MSDDLSLLDITYRLVFRRPMFALASNIGGALEVFHRHLSTRYKVDLNAMQAFPATSVGGVGFSIGLFAGKGRLELRVDRFDAEFRSIRNADNKATAEDCLGLARLALAEALAEVEFSVLRISALTWWKLDGGPERARRLLLEAVSAPILKRLPKEDQTANWLSVLNMKCSDESSEIDLQFFGDVSAISETDLYLGMDATARGSLASAPVEQQTTALSARYEAFTRAMGLKPKSEEQV